jgi:hypothetical protein
MRKHDAADKAWDELREKYAPRSPASEPVPNAQVVNRELTAEDLGDWLCGAAEREVQRWAAKHNVTLTADAMNGLAGEMVTYCWMMGLMGYHPGPLYREEVEATRWCLRPPQNPHQPEPLAPAIGGF